MSVWQVSRNYVLNSSSFTILCGDTFPALVVIPQMSTQWYLLALSLLPIVLVRGLLSSLGFPP